MTDAAILNTNLYYDEQADAWAVELLTGAGWVFVDYADDRQEADNIAQEAYDKLCEKGEMN